MWTTRLGINANLEAILNTHTHTHTHTHIHTHTLLEESWKTFIRTTKFRSY